MPRWERREFARYLLGRNLRRGDERECFLKKKYTEEAALVEAERWNRKQGERVAHAYRCNACGEWHTGRKRD
jgi:hypothetical protein